MWFRERCIGNLAVSNIHGTRNIHNQHMAAVRESEKNCGTHFSRSVLTVLSIKKILLDSCEYKNVNVVQLCIGKQAHASGKSIN